MIVEFLPEENLEEKRILVSVEIIIKYIYFQNF